MTDGSTNRLLDASVGEQWRVCGSGGERLFNADYDMVDLGS